MSNLKRLRFAQNSWIDVERLGGAIVGGTATDWIDLGYVVWSEIAIGKPVRVRLHKRGEKGTVELSTRPLESVEVIEKAQR